MPAFRSRNLLYLRVDTQTILPVFLHLDDQNGHTEWMTQSTLEQVVEDMRYLIGPKIEAEDRAAVAPGPSSMKKTSGVDVFRGKTYQFGYYLEKADHHTILIKHQSFVPAAPLVSAKPAVTASVSPRAFQPTRESGLVSSTQGKKRARPQSLEVDDLDQQQSREQTEVHLVPTPLQPRRSRRTKSRVANYQELSDSEQQRGQPGDELGSSNARQSFQEPGEDDGYEAEIKMEHSDHDDILHYPSLSNPLPSPFDVDDSDNEDAADKKKLKLTTSYTGFTISKYKLCLIVQPYPPLPKPGFTSKSPGTQPSRVRDAPASSLLPSRQAHLAPFIHLSPTPGPQPSRRRTPLFREPSMTPAPDTVLQETSPLKGLTMSLGDSFGPSEGLNAADNELENLMEVTQSFSLASGTMERMGVPMYAGGISANVDADEDGWLMGDADERND
ncbi:uncharacterized protein EI90DRAFT_3082002 [Cantharellus anzutake]|uniref:uncharacterized protein n=1 Tax=Cantharellus anzutake TaxID=1750568 RepID=UPI0019038B5C|nr:uncharacterized protein EI90DRAFT_3082002 [Cantharellus anzutake]KAF8319528.1 hypothetical protein EI90DRAFT_3082002 [Cantharellus anzutake]